MDIRINLAMIVVAGTAALVYGKPEWRERVIPQPREMTVQGSVKASASTISMELAATNAVQAETIRQVMQPWAQGKPGEAKVKIAFVLLDDARVPEALRKRLEACPNRDQAYAITAQAPADKGKLALMVAAPTAVGLLYGAQTLSQLTAPAGKEKGATEREVPIVEIVDWPNMRGRGEWGSNVAADMDWYSRWKMNWVNTSAGCHFDPNTGAPLITSVKAEQISHAATFGINLVPFIPHMGDSIYGGNMAVLGKCRDNPAYKHLAPMIATPDPKKPFDPNPGYPGPGLCFSSPVTADVFTEWLRQTVKISYPYHKDTMIWLTEVEHTPCCYCKECAGKSRFELETAMCLKIFDRVKREYPGLFMYVCLTQASYPFNDKIIAKVKDRKDVGLVYYSGSLTYISDYKPMIYPLLTDYAQSGRRLGVYPQVTPNWYTVFPWTAPQFIHFRATEFVDKHLDNICGYAVPDKKYYDFNMKALAEWLWNAKGRTPVEFARTYALQQGSADPDLYAQWSLKAGEAGWALAESDFIKYMAEDPLLVFRGMQSFITRSGITSVADFRADLWGMKPFVTPQGITTNQLFARIRSQLETAQEAVALARRLGLPEAEDESEACYAAMRAACLYEELSGIITGRNSAASRAELAQKLDGMDECAHIIRTRVFSWADRIEARRGKRKMQERVDHTAVCLLRACDALRIVAATRFGVPDPRPESRVTELIDCTGAGFWGTNLVNTFEVFEADISARVPPEGGSYHACFDFGGVVRKVEAIAQIGTNRVTLALSPEPANDYGYIQGENYIECRLNIPARPAYSQLFLRVEMECRRQKWLDDRGYYEGLIGWRKVWAKGASPWEQPTTSAAAPVQTTLPLRIGVARGLADAKLIACLNRQPGIKAFILYNYQPDTLTECDALIFPQKERSPLRLIRGLPAIRRWVEQGGGVMFLHDAVGYRRNPAVFPEVGAGIEHAKLHTVQIATNHPVTAGLAASQSFTPGFQYDHIAIHVGEQGKTVVKNEKGQPVMVVGEIGQGRVVLNGMLTGRKGGSDDGAGTDTEPEGDELKVLLNAVQWLGNRNVR